MRPEEYERITASMADALFAKVEGARSLELGYGKRNRLRGQSGYEHQIDVSVRGERDLVLAECKCWNRPIAVGDVLAFLGRVHDIAPVVEPLRIHPFMMSQLGFQRGAKMIADYYRIRLFTGNSDSWGIGYKTAASLTYRIRAPSEYRAGKNPKPGPEGTE